MPLKRWRLPENKKPTLVGFPLRARRFAIIASLFYHDRMAVMTNSNQTVDLTGFPPTLKNQVEQFQSLGVRFVEEDHGDYFVVIAWNIQTNSEGLKRPR